MAENILGAFILSEVASAEKDFANFRDRTISTISVSGGLVTVLVGLLALAAGDRKEFLPADGKPWLAWSMGFLIFSAILGIVAQFPVEFPAASVSALEGFVEKNWDEDGWDRSIARQQIDYLKELRRANKEAAQNFRAALTSQLIAIILLAVLAWKIFSYLT